MRPDVYKIEDCYILHESHGATEVHTARESHMYNIGVVYQSMADNLVTSEPTVCEPSCRVRTIVDRRRSPSYEQRCRYVFPALFR